MGRKLFPVVILAVIGFGLALFLLTRPDSGDSDSGGSDSGDSLLSRNSALWDFQAGNRVQISTSRRLPQIRPSVHGPRPPGSWQ